VAKHESMATAVTSNRGHRSGVRLIQSSATTAELLKEAGGPRNKTDASFVGGVSDGTYRLAAQELHAKACACKAWMMFDDGFAAGAGTSCDSDLAVMTSLNQCLVAQERRCIAGRALRLA
jgi:hypothetical protein